MITLRNAQSADAEAIAALHAQSWRQHYRGIYSDAYLDSEAASDRLAVWRSRLEQPDERQRIFLAPGDDTLAGFACIFLNDDPAFGTLLDNLHVAVQYHKSGIGRMLMQACARQILAAAATPGMYLWVYEQNSNAIQVYERLGGTLFEKITKQNADGTTAATRRYVWADVSVLLS